MWYKSLEDARKVIDLYGPTGDVPKDCEMTPQLKKSWADEKEEDLEKTGKALSRKARTKAKRQSERKAKIQKLVDEGKQPPLVCAKCNTKHWCDFTPCQGENAGRWIR